MHAIYQHRTDNEVPRRLPVVEDDDGDDDRAADCRGRRLTRVAARTPSSYRDPLSGIPAEDSGDEKAADASPTKRQTRRAIIYSVYRVGFVRVARSAISQQSPFRCRRSFRGVCRRTVKFTVFQIFGYTVRFLGGKKGPEERALVYFATNERNSIFTNNETVRVDHRPGQRERCKTGKGGRKRRRTGRVATRKRTRSHLGVASRRPFARVDSRCTGTKSRCWFNWLARVMMRNVI